MSNENQRDHVNFDSYPIKFMIKKNVSRQKIKRRKVFNYSEADWEGMACEIESYDWINIFNGLRICDAWNSFKSKLDISMRIHIPMKTVKFRIQPPWFDSEIFEMTKSINIGTFIRKQGQRWIEKITRHIQLPLKIRYLKRKVNLFLQTHVTLKIFATIK